jgi:hypothetical protein
MEKTLITKIAIFPKIQPDTVAAVFLLKKYGALHFPGVEEAEVVFWTATEPGKSAEAYEAEGTLLIDLAGSRFDHHRDDHGRKSECASSLVAKHLGVDRRPEVRKLLAYAKRDDLEGKGTISTDPLDRAFGLSGIIMNLNRVHRGNPQAIFDFVYAIFEAHVHDEWRRTTQMPEEWKAIKASGAAIEFTADHGKKNLRCIALESENVDLPGFLRAYVKADVVIQRLPSGHTNVITRQVRRVDLRDAVALIRSKEAEHRGVTVDHHDHRAMRKPGRLEGLDMWFYDTAANTIQNGGVNPQDIPPTKMDLELIAGIVAEGLAMRSNAGAVKAPQRA